MISASALQGFTLKKTGIVRNTDFVSGVEKENAQQARLRAVDLEAWYDCLAPHTFKTVFVPISRLDAEAMIAHYWDLKHDRDKGIGSSPLQDQSLMMSALKEKITTAMTELSSMSASLLHSGVFAKLSSRSPKDSRFCEERAFVLISKRLLAEKSKSNKLDNVSANSAVFSTASQQCVSPNFIAATVMSCSIESLRVNSAAEVLMALCTSDRCCEDDLPLALSFPLAAWSQHIVVREWRPIQTQFEFRGFVIDGRLTGLTQYYAGSCFPTLLNHRQRVVDLIRRFFAHIEPSIPMRPREYVVDFAVELIDCERASDENSDTVYPGDAEIDSLDGRFVDLVHGDRAWIIEFNPFGAPDGMGSGTVLFNLHCPDDLAILMGHAPFEFRVVELENAPRTIEDLSLDRHGRLRALLQTHGMI